MLVLFAAALLGGCTAPPMIATAGVSAVQAGTEAFVRGDMVVAERAPLKSVYEAVHNAMVRLELPIEQETLYDNVGFVTAQEVSGWRVKVTLKRASPIITKISIRVGAWGDLAVSRLVMAEIQAQLAPVWGPKRAEAPP